MGRYKKRQGVTVSDKKKQVEKREIQGEIERQGMTEGYRGD